MVWVSHQLNCAQDEVQPINWACLWGHTAAARAILRDPSVVQHVAARKSDALSWCCHKGHAETLKVLLESVHISHTHSNSPTPVFRTLTPLQLAVCYGKDLKTVELVLAQGVDVDETIVATKKTALAIAASNHSYEIVAALLKHGASVKVDSDDKSAFRYLFDDCHNYDYGKTAALVNMFVAERPNDNLQNDLPYLCRTMIMLAPLIRELLKLGADVNARSAGGLTPLRITVYYALNLPAAEVFKCNIRALVLGGADLTAKTTAAATEEDLVLCGYDIPGGMTPMDVARTCGKDEMLDAVVATLTAAIAQRAL